MKLHPSRTGQPALLLALLAAAISPLPGQATSQYKGVWEPVSYTEDIALGDVFFVTPEIGWVAGDKGTILHTRDGGATWTAQLGGDPGSSERRIDRLYFVDERHGWAVQDEKLFSTSDGENWEQVGALPNAFDNYVFVSRTVGFAGATSTSQGNADHIFGTTDGGKTWTPAAPCLLKVLVDGLAQQIICHTEAFYFPSATTGYVVASRYSRCACYWPPIIGKTTDGGASWQFQLGPGDPKEAMLVDVVFANADNGMVLARPVRGEMKLYATSDGAASWRGIVATPGKQIRFADPEVGWSVDNYHFSFTVNGGRTWTSRPLRFPGDPKALSFPRRDRAYVVGDHGMIYRYRVVPASAPLATSALPAPAMPALAPTLEREAAELVTALAAMQADAAGVTRVARSTAASSTTDASSAGKSSKASKMARLDQLFLGLTMTVPDFLARYTNLNLLAARLRAAGDLPARLEELRTGLAALKAAPDAAAVDAALKQALAAGQGLHETAAVALQQKLPTEETASTAESE